jgi:hypothetical protein
MISIAQSLGSSNAQKDLTVFPEKYRGSEFFRLIQKKEPLSGGFSEKNQTLTSELSCDDRGEALDLIKGHLPYSCYVPVTRGLGNDPVNWFMPDVGYDPAKPLHQVLKIQPFVAGGYEVTVTTQELGKIAALMDGSRKTGERVKGEQKANDVITSVNRSKKKIRHLIKSMGCDRLLTLTKKESDPDSFWTIEQWAVAWDRFVRLCRKAGCELQYVAVPELHSKGNYHLHAAIVGHISVNVIRGIWLAITGGKGSGNVDIAFKRNCTEHARRAGLAKYVSKYVTKQIGQTEFNKKRYWSSKHKLPPPRRYILNSMDMLGAFEELSAYLGLSLFKVVDKAYQFDSVKDGVHFPGLWFSFDDDLVGPVPF